MKIFLILILFAGMLIASSAAAQITIPNPLGSGGSDVPTLINTIANWLLGIGATISTIVIIWAAIVFMTSGGNKDRVTMARQTLWYAIIGLTILLLADGISILIQNFLSGRF